VFYNNSTFDGRDPAAGAADDAAIAVDKSPLLPGQAPTWDHVTSYSKGINGVMIDVEGLPQDLGVTREDFDLDGAPPPASVAVRRGAGAGASDRITLTWPDGAVRDTWLRVTVKSGERTGLAAPDVFCFGNLVGETGDRGSPSRVTALDLRRVRAALFSDAGITSP
jgi:hypothetical protein